MRALGVALTRVCLSAGPWGPVPVLPGALRLGCEPEKLQPAPLSWQECHPVGLGGRVPGEEARQEWHRVAARMGLPLLPVPWHSGVPALFATPLTGPLFQLPVGRRHLCRPEPRSPCGDSARPGRSTAEPPWWERGTGAEQLRLTHGCSLGGFLGGTPGSRGILL